MGPCCSKPPFKQLCSSFQAGDRKFSPSRAAGQKGWPTLLSLGHHEERVPSRQGVTGKLLIPVDVWLGKCQLFRKALGLTLKTAGITDVTFSFTKSYCIFQKLNIFPRSLVSGLSCSWPFQALAHALLFLQGLRPEMFGSCLCSPTNKLSLSLISHTSISAKLSPAGAANAAL